MTKKNIEQQLDAIIKRSKSLPQDHPARKGILKTIEKLNVELQAED